MTREFNKQSRDGSRPPFRNSSSNQPGDERSSRPARPRLNREMVDRAWENGATRTHADYHTRSSNGQSQSTSNNWRNNQRSGNSSQQVPGGRKPYGQGQNNYDRNNAQRSDRPYGNQQGPNSSHSSSANRYGNSADRPGIDSRRPFSGSPANPRGRQENRPPYERGPLSRGPENRPPYERGPENRPSYERGPISRGPGNRSPYERGPASRGPENRPPYERGPASRGPDNRPPYERGPASRGPGNRPPYERGPASRGPGNRPPYERGPASRGPGNRPPYERGPASRGPEGMAPGTRGAARYERPERDFQRGKNDSNRGNQSKSPKTEAQRAPNPRWLSRPEVRLAQDAQRQQEQDEQFEGDYEQFDTQETSKRSSSVERGSNHRRPRNAEDAERHVTKLDDGRVLKGSRPAQRKNAQFWTEINEDTSKLVEQVTLPDDEAGESVEQITLPDGDGDTRERVEPVKLADDELGAETEPSDDGSQTTAPAAKKKQARRPVGRKAKKVDKDGEEAKPRVRGPRPSQKGYTWPTS
jgi:hypothetical protein